MTRPSLSSLFAFLLIGGCHKSAPAVVDAAIIAAPPVSASAAPVLVDAGAHAIAQSVFHRWNLAHNEHDARALEALYASEVDFYGTKLSGAECVKRKAAAFAKSPDYKQKVFVFSFVDDKGTTYASFHKTTFIKGKEEHYAASIAVKDGHITEETDDTTKENLRVAARTPEDAKRLWCLDSKGDPNDKIIPPFKISASTAVWAIASSKAFAETGAASPNAVMIDHCPTECGAAPRTCGYDMTLQGMILAGSEYIAVSRTFYIDAVTKLLWWEDGTWKSEQLPP